MGNKNENSFTIGIALLLGFIAGILTFVLTDMIRKRKYTMDAEKCMDASNNGFACDAHQLYVDRQNIYSDIETSFNKIK